MEEKPKKQIHKPEFLYMDNTNITPLEHQKGIGQPAPSWGAEKVQRKQGFPSAEDDMGFSGVRDFAVYNDLIVSILDRLPTINHFFSVPEVPKNLTTVREVKNLPEYAESQGSYAEVIVLAEQQGVPKDVLDKSFNTLAAQKYALLQLWVKAEDAHGNNILIRQNPQKEMIPIPVNYARSLGFEPNDKKMLPRTTRWESWPALKLPIDPLVYQFIMKSSAKQLAEELKQAFMKEFEGELSDEQKLIFLAKFNHFEANVIMVQEAVKEGLNFRQILALILPHIDKRNFHFVTGGVLEGGELWPARERFASLHTSFLDCWNKANQNEKFSAASFKKEIVKEIEKIKNLPPPSLEEHYFAELAFELRRALFL